MAALDMVYGLISYSFHYVRPQTNRPADQMMNPTDGANLPIIAAINSFPHPLYYFAIFLILFSLRKPSFQTQTMDNKY